MLGSRLLRYVDRGRNFPYGSGTLSQKFQNLDAPRLLADLEAVERYNPTVRSVQIQGAQERGVGAKRTCQLSPSGRVTERVTTWEEGRAVGLEVVESDWPIVFMRWVTRVESLEGGARLTQSLEYEVKFGIVGRLLDFLVMKRKLTSTLDEVLRSLVKLAEAKSG